MAYSFCLLYAICSFVLNAHPFPIPTFQRMVCRLIQAAWKTNINFACVPLFIIVVILAVVMGVIIPSFITVLVCHNVRKEEGADYLSPVQVAVDEALASDISYHIEI
jgi:hypothetical protein